MQWRYEVPAQRPSCSYVPQGFPGQAISPIETGFVADFADPTNDFAFSSSCGKRLISRRSSKVFTCRWWISVSHISGKWCGAPGVLPISNADNDFLSSHAGNFAASSLNIRNVFQDLRTEHLLVIMNPGPAAW